MRAQAVSRGGERVRAERGAGLVEALRSGPDRAEPRRPGPAEERASGPAKRERERARLMGAGPRERVLDWAWEGGLGWVWV